MKNAKMIKRIVVIAAALTMLFSMSASAGAIGYGVTVVNNKVSEIGPGPGMGSADQGSAIVGNGPVIEDEPSLPASQPAEAAGGENVNAGNEVVSNGPGAALDAPTGDQGAVQFEDTATLIEKSLANPYKIFETADPNIVVSRGRTLDKTKPMVALTYDDGPQTAAGNRIIDVFNQYNQRTTFFMVGDRIPSRADEVRRMAQSGHEVANHTYSHTYLNRVGAETIRSQVTKCNDVIEQTCGVRPRVMRLPGGNKNATVLANVNMPIILWNIDTRDWDHRNVSKILAAVNGKLKDGDIVLMHELYDATATASETMVPQLVNAGFQLVTISEMAEIKGLSLMANQVYYSF